MKKQILMACALLSFFLLGDLLFINKEGDKYFAINQKMSKTLDQLKKNYTIKVGIIEHSFYKNHKIFKDKSVRFRKFGDLNNHASHGNHIFGIISEINPNQRYYLYEFSSKENEVNNYLSALERAIIIDNVDIINLSISSESLNEKILNKEKELLELASREGKIVIVSSGNESSNLNITKSYPCSYDIKNVICVGYYSKKNNKSNHGNAVDFYYYGKVRSATRKGYSVLEGSSQATAFITAFVVKLKSYYKDYNIEEIKGKLSKHSKVKNLRSGQGKFVQFKPVINEIINKGNRIPASSSLEEK